MATYLELNKDITEEEEAVKQQVHRFAEEVLRPVSLELDKMPPEKVIDEDSPYWGVMRQAYQLGYSRSYLPPALGGAGLSPLARHIYTEEMGWGSADFAVGIGVTAFPFGYAAMSGNQDILKEHVLPFTQDSEARFIGCWAITEPQHGSDMLIVGTETFRNPEAVGEVRARMDGDDWVINGQKSAWVSNGTVATHALLFLNTDPSKGQEGGGVAFVPLNLPGITKGKPLDKLGQRALNQGEIFFDNVHLPKEYMIVGPDAYSYVLHSVLAGANGFMGATFTGLARAAFEEGLNYARNRMQGAKPITEHQAVQLKIADMFIKVETARQFSRAAMVYNSTTSPPQVQYSQSSKVYCTTVAFQVASDALQLHGGMGLAKEMLIEKLFRDARASLIEDGTNDVMSLSAARKIIDTY